MGKAHIQAGWCGGALGEPFLSRSRLPLLCRDTEGWGGGRLGASVAKHPKSRRATCRGGAAGEKLLLNPSGPSTCLLPRLPQCSVTGSLDGWGRSWAVSQEARQGGFWISLDLGNRARTRMKGKRREGEKTVLWASEQEGQEMAVW